MRYYLDTEFDGFGGRLISLALVREDGEGVYYAFEFEPAYVSEPWVRENVMPILDASPVKPTITTPQSAAGEIAAFMAGDPDPVVVTDWPADIRYLCEVIEFPGGNMAPIPGLTFELKRVDAYPTTLPGALQHNAWWDAMALRHRLIGAN